MTVIWDFKADTMIKGDGLREITPLQDKIHCDSDGYTHYIFQKKMFHNPKYKIPTDEAILFEKFLDGGSRSYPSDGNIPLDIVATEARILINKIVDIATNPEELYYVEPWGLTGIPYPYAWEFGDSPQQGDDPFPPYQLDPLKLVLERRDVSFPSIQKCFLPGPSSWSSSDTNRDSLRLWTIRQKQKSALAV